MRAALVAVILIVALPAQATAADLTGHDWKTLGVRYETRGNLEKAAYCYKMAALANNVRGQVLLANAYHHGRGVPQSVTIAFAWYMTASAKCKRKGLPAPSHRGPTPTAEQWRAGRDLHTFLFMLSSQGNPKPDCTEFDD